MPRLTATRREEIYDAARGEREHPICKLCDLPIVPGQEWDVSHDKHLPKALGGKVDGIAHRRCNREHGHSHDTPLVAKAKRIRQKHIGAWQPRTVMPGSRESGLKRKMNGTVERRS